MAMRLLEEGIHGAMVAHRNGGYAYTDMPNKDHHARRVNPADYNERRFRPNFESINGPYMPLECD